MLWRSPNNDGNAVSFERCCETMHAVQSSRVCSKVIWTYSCGKEELAARQQWMHVVGLTASNVKDWLVELCKTIDGGKEE